MIPYLEKRPQASRHMVYLTPLFALGLTLIAGVILFSLMGVNPGKALYAFFVEPLSSSYGLSELGVKATPLVLIGVALSIGFRAGVWNIGAEGQLTLGAIAGGGIALWFYDVESFWVLPLMIVFGILGGMFWAARSATCSRYASSTGKLLSTRGERPQDRCGTAVVGGGEIGGKRRYRPG